MKRKFSEKIFYTTFYVFNLPDAMNTKYSIANMSYYARESAKLLIVNFIENTLVKGIGIGHGAGVISSEEAS